MATVTIGGISLSEWEIPERINFGGGQANTVHKLIGGNRVVDAMGPDPDPIRWSGRFRGPTALLRANALDAMRSAGAQVPLIYLGKFLIVLISEFRADAERFYEIPYQITCTVVTDSVNGALGNIVSGLDVIVNSALAVAAAFTAGGTSSAELATSAAVGMVFNAVDAAGSLQDASAAVLQSVSTTVYTASTSLSGIANSLDATLGVGVGTLPGVDPDQMVAFLNTQLQNCTDEAETLGARDNIDLIGKNLALSTG